MKGRGVIGGHYINIYFQANLSHFLKDSQLGFYQILNPEAFGALITVGNRDEWICHAAYNPSNRERLEDSPIYRGKAANEITLICRFCFLNHYWFSSSSVC